MNSTIPVSILCGLPLLRHAVESSLPALGFHCDPAASTALVLDVPRGYGFRALETMNRRGLRVIVVSWSSCPEYLEDLWDLGPDLLLSGRYLYQNLPEVIGRVSGTERYRLTPGSPTALTPVERTVLRHLAQGWGNKRIAQELKVQERTVMNTLTRVYEKLSVENRAQAALYYWGLPQAFDDLSFS